MKVHITTITLIISFIGLSSSINAEWWDGWDNANSSAQGYGTAQGNMNSSGNAAGDYRGTGQGWGTGTGGADGNVDFALNFKGKGRTNMDATGNLEGHSQASGNAAENGLEQGNTSGNFQGNGYAQSDNLNYGAFPSSAYQGYGSNLPWGDVGASSNTYQLQTPPASLNNNINSYQQNIQQMQAHLETLRQQYEAYAKLIEQQKRAQIKFQSNR